MEDELNGVVPCSSLAVESTIRVGTAGALWGLCMGPYNSRKNGLRGVGHAAFVAKSVGKYGFQCGLVAGTFTLTHCGIQRYRRKNDWWQEQQLPRGLEAGHRYLGWLPLFLPSVPLLNIQDRFRIPLVGTGTGRISSASFLSLFKEVVCMLVCWRRDQILTILIQS
ncbi:outer envelope pore protein 16-4, chloroplastic isoform X1 [Momordica charantia]|uniref:Outer envelope pore protein 16-4, chloroplastic isoform X1 n=1 Tax=Momordica charantia TaxID=3673 RepID=A0A6J1CRG7_MOMCH|nr:outer envelope pore protein 16-4, chloroplastic isoform X1 [Momordica charantia]